jgi:hypothetical protein
MMPSDSDGGDEEMVLPPNQMVDSLRALFADGGSWGDSGNGTPEIVVEKRGSQMISTVYSNGRIKSQSLYSESGALETSQTWNTTTGLLSQTFETIRPASANDPTITISMSDSNDHGVLNRRWTTYRYPIGKQENRSTFEILEGGHWIQKGSMAPYRGAQYVVAECDGYCSVALDPVSASSRRTGSADAGADAGPDSHCDPTKGVWGLAPDLPQRFRSLYGKIRIAAYSANHDLDFPGPHGECPEAVVDGVKTTLLSLVANASSCLGYIKPNNWEAVVKMVTGGAELRYVCGRDCTTGDGQFTYGAQTLTIDVSDQLPSERGRWFAGSVTIINAKMFLESTDAERRGGLLHEMMHGALRKDHEPCPDLLDPTMTDSGDGSQYDHIEEGPFSDFIYSCGRFCGNQAGLEGIGVCNSNPAGNSTDQAWDCARCAGEETRGLCLGKSAAPVATGCVDNSTLPESEKISGTFGAAFCSATDDAPDVPLPGSNCVGLHPYYCDDTDGPSWGYPSYPQRDPPPPGLVCANCDEPIGVGCIGLYLTQAPFIGGCLPGNTGAAAYLTQIQEGLVNTNYLPSR